MVKGRKEKGSGQKKRDIAEEVAEIELGSQVEKMGGNKK